MNTELRTKTDPERYNIYAFGLSIVALLVALWAVYYSYQQRSEAPSPVSSKAQRAPQAESAVNVTGGADPTLRAATPTWAKKTSLDRIRSDRIIRAGYSGFKPYTIITPSAAGSETQITGFCADMLHEMASRQDPPWRIEWHKVTFETLKADMESGRFDVFADAVYQTVPRAADFGFTIPYSYFGVAVGLVRKGEKRFTRFDDLDRPDITIALAQGWTSTEYAQRHLSKPKFHLIPVADDPFVQLQEVIAGRADIALQDVPTILQFYKVHKGAVSTLWLDSPPTRVPAGFMTRQGEFELLHFLDVSIRALHADGTLEAIDRKWLSLGDLPALTLRPGAGLQEKQ